MDEIARWWGNCGTYTDQANSEDGYRSRNTVDDASVATAPVGSYLPNALGLYDMIGNVKEYTAECASGWNQHATSYFAQKFRSEDATLGMTKEKPLRDYCGYDADHLYQVVYGSGFREGDSLWNVYISESGSWCALRECGIRLMFAVGE